MCSPHATGAIMIPRYIYLNYDRSHDTAERIYKMLIVRIRLQLAFPK